jgi:hypothetical protein
VTVRLHHMGNRTHDDAVRHLCAELHAAETLFPGTKLRLVYELVSAQIPRPREVWGGLSVERTLSRQRWRAWHALTRLVAIIRLAENSPILCSVGGGSPSPYDPSRPFIPPEAGDSSARSDGHRVRPVPGLTHAQADRVQAPHLARRTWGHRRPSHCIHSLGASVVATMQRLSCP